MKKKKPKKPGYNILSIKVLLTSANLCFRIEIGEIFLPKALRIQIFEHEVPVKTFLPILGNLCF